MRLIERVRRWPVTRYVPTWVKRSIRRAHSVVVRRPSVAANGTPVADAARPAANEIEALIVRIYQLALNRIPGTDERQLWARQVLEGHLSAARLVEVIASSPEAAEVRARAQLVPTVSNGRFVQFAYEYLLGRGAMASEIAHWDHRLNHQSLGRDQMALALFAKCAEEALTDAAKPVPYDPSLAHVMGTDRFISVQEWQDKATSVPVDAPRVVPIRYPSLELQPGGEVLVSAIASLYRGGEFVEQFLENITSQTIFARSELIIIDADSPENEFAVISRYMERFPNIVYHRASTRIGIYEAWNLGVHLSKGRYITNTNLDDLRRVDSLERQAEILEKFPFVDVVYQDFYFSFEGHASFDRSAAVGVRSEVPVITPYNLMQSNSPHNAPMWRRTLHSDVGMFDASFRSAGDYDFWLRCVQARKTFFKVNDPHVIYFVNPEGLSTQPNTRGIDEANRITKAQGRRMISPWLLADDQAYIAEVTQRTGSDIAFSDAARADPDWRYVAAQQALRRLSADSRSRSTQ